VTDVDQAGIEDPGETRTTAPSRFGARTMTIVAAALSLVIVATLAAAVVLFLRNRDDDQLAHARADALTAANAFALAMDDVNGANFDAYIKRINGLLTTKAKTKNIQGLSALRTVYSKGKVKGTGKLLLSGVGDSDLDSATVLVVHDATVNSTAGTVKHHYRWTVTMQKVGDRWLVDDFASTSQEPSQ
jgi:Mce-associated membrane protein